MHKWVHLLEKAGTPPTGNSAYFLSFPENNMLSADTKASFPVDHLLSLLGMLLAFFIQQQLCIVGQTLQVVCQSFPKAFHLPAFL